MLKQRIYEIDFIRSVALLIIIFFHYLESGILELGLLREPESFIFHGINLLHFGGVNLSLGNWGVSLFLIISGASLMYVYEEGLEVKDFYKKRVRSIMPLYYLAFLLASTIQLLIYKGRRWSNAANWTIILTFLGIDGWLGEVIPNFALVGDWYVGTILIIYLFFPIFYKAIKKFPHITLLVYAVIFMIWEFAFPFEFSKRNSIILRGFEVVLGMYFMERWKNVTLCTCLFSCGIIFLLIFVKIEIISLYILVPIAGATAFLAIFYFSGYLKAKWIQNPVCWLSKYSYPVFLIHHFVLNKIFERIKPASLDIGNAIILFFISLFLIFILGYALKKLEYVFSQTLRYLKKCRMNISN